MSWLLKDETEITENFGDKVEDLIAVINHFHEDNKLEYLEDDYFLEVYLYQCIQTRDLQFMQDVQNLVTYLYKIDYEVTKLRSRMNSDISHHKPRDIDSEILQLSKAKEIFCKYSNPSNKEAQTAIGLLSRAIGELNSMKVELRSYIFRHKDLPKKYCTMVHSAHLKSWSTSLLEYRIDFFKPKPQTINECINNNFFLVKRQFSDNLNIEAVRALFDFLKNYYKAS